MYVRVYVHVRYAYWIHHLCFSYDEPDLEYDYEDLVPDTSDELNGLGAHGGGAGAQGPPGAHGYDR